MNKWTNEQMNKQAIGQLNQWTCDKINQRLNVSTIKKPTMKDNQRSNKSKIQWKKNQKTEFKSISWINKTNLNKNKQPNHYLLKS